MSMDFVVLELSFFRSAIAVDDVVDDFCCEREVSDGTSSFFKVGAGANCG